MNKSAEFYGADTKKKKKNMLTKIKLVLYSSVFYCLSQGVN